MTSTEQPQLQEPAKEPIFKGFPFIGYWSDKGKVREENEDSFYVPPQNLDAQVLQRKGYLCIVADGMGGHAKGGVASALAVKRVAEEYYVDPTLDVETSLRRAIQKANNEVFTTAQRTENAGMGTTMVAAVSIGNGLYVACVGDSRAYLVANGQATQITKDHSWVQERVDEGTLTQQQAEQHAQRNIITRALGTKPQVAVDVFTPAVTPGELIFLCSDGLSGLVRPEEIAAAVSKFPPQAAAQQLVALANERGGPDNITAVVLPVNPGAGNDQHAQVVPGPGKGCNPIRPLQRISDAVQGAVIQVQEAFRPKKIIPVHLPAGTIPAATATATQGPIVETQQPAEPIVYGMGLSQITEDKFRDVFSSDPVITKVNKVVARIPDYNVEVEIPPALLVKAYSIWKGSADKGSHSNVVILPVFYNNKWYSFFIQSQNLTNILNTSTSR